MNISCMIKCEHNTGFGECMWGVNAELIEHAKSGKPMCEFLRWKVLGLTYSKQIDNILKRLDEMKGKPTELVYDVPLINSIIEIVKEEGGIE